MNLPHDDLEAIRQLKYAYCRCIDTANWEELPGLFIPEASVRYEGGSYLFEAEGRDKILEALRYAFHSEAIALHHVNHPEITVSSATEAKGTWYLKDWFLDLRHRIITDGSALYRDDYVKRDGRWLIRRATYTRIYEIVTPVTETPNITAHLLARTGQKLPATAG
jgi:hypothetical protein